MPNRTAYELQLEIAEVLHAMVNKSGDSIITVLSSAVFDASLTCKFRVIDSDTWVWYLQELLKAANADQISGGLLDIGQSYVYKEGLKYAWYLTMSANAKTMDGAVQALRLVLSKLIDIYTGKVYPPVEKIRLIQKDAQSMEAAKEIASAAPNALKDLLRRSREARSAPREDIDVAEVLASGPEIGPAAVVPVRLSIISENEFSSSRVTGPRIEPTGKPRRRG